MACNPQQLIQDANCVLCEIPSGMLPAAALAALCDASVNIMPGATFFLLFEDGSGHLLLEDGFSLLLENAP